MRHRFSIHQGPPADANRYKSLAWIKTVHSPLYVTVKAWRGKALKPFAHYSFRVSPKLTAEARADQWIADQQIHEDGLEQLKAQRKVDRAQRKADMQQQIQVGTILHGSWGYEQTQCEYFEVIERTGNIAVVREIASRTKPGSEGFMSDSRYPVPGQFIGEPIKKVIGPYGLSFEHFTLTPTDPAQAHSCTWYG